MRIPIGIFCETYGNTLRNRVLENLMEFESTDTSAGAVAKSLGISRPKVYEIFKEFLEKGFIKKTRVLGKTQLYIINKGNDRVKLFLRDFNECLRFVIRQYTSKSKGSSSGKSGAVSAKGI